MRIEANHHDGFTEHQLRWQLVDDGQCTHVTATWTDPNPPRHKATRSFEIEIDRSAIVANLPKLRELNRKYDCGWDDAGNLVLTIECEGVTDQWRLHGSEGLIKDRPELKTFFEVWRPIHDKIESALAIPGRGR